MIDKALFAQIRRIQVRTNRLVTEVMAGGYSSVFRGSGIEFDEVREFADGDDPRAVDWNVTARTGRPFVKKFVEERELTVLFVLDLSASLRFGGVGAAAKRPREAAAEFCACLALAAARNHDRVGLIAFSDRIERFVPASKGSRHILRLIREALALQAAGTGSQLGAALEYAGRVQRKRAVVFVISDFLAVGDFARPLALLARRHDVVAVRVLAPTTVELPAAGLLHLRDLETGRAQWIDTSSPRVRAAHALRMRSWREELLGVLRRAKVDLLEVRTDRSVADPIVAFFRMRELRGARG